MEDLVRELIVTCLIPTLGTILMAVATAAAFKILQKYNIDIKDKTIRDAVLFAEDLGRKYAQTGGHMPGTWKLDSAMTFIGQRIPKAKKDKYLQLFQEEVNAKVQELFHVNRPKPEEGK